jgi:sulfite reductase alpha subunit-like flavoprotein
VVGVLAAVEPAFSRDQQEKVYVQHRIKQHSQLVCQVLQDPTAHVFVAGSAGACVSPKGIVNNWWLGEMPKAVRAAFAAALEECSGLSADESEAALRLIEKQRRYHVECWS